MLRDPETVLAGARTLVVADDPIVRDALTARLGATAIADAATGDDVADIVARVGANAVLWDLGPAGTVDPELAARLESIAVPVVALAGGSARADLLGAALAAGLAGLLARDTPADVLQQALVTALHGLLVLDRAFAPEPGGIVEPGSLTRTADGEALTAREQEVVQLMAEGLSNKQIADRLGISAHTAKFHVNAVLGKLGASTRTEAVVRALQRGVVML
jgi:DNA-binding NarL/FixJ family response regulator